MVNKHRPRVLAACKNTVPVEINYFQNGLRCFKVLANVFQNQKQFFCGTLIIRNTECVMGVGTNTLGYCNPVVDSAVIKLSEKHDHVELSRRGHVS